MLEVKPKAGITGKANLKVFAKNGRGSATIMITKVRGGDLMHVKHLAFKVIKYLLDKVISGEISMEDIELIRRNLLVKQKRRILKTNVKFVRRILHPNKK